MRPTTLQFHPNSFLHWDNYTGSYLSIISLCLVPVYIVMSVAQLKQSTESLEHHFAVHNEIKKSKVENKTPPPKRPAGNLAGIWDLGSGIWDLGSGICQFDCCTSEVFFISYFDFVFRVSITSSHIFDGCLLLTSQIATFTIICADYCPLLPNLVASLTSDCRWTT
jgi:hypothetical protein